MERKRRGKEMKRLLRRKSESEKGDEMKGAGEKKGGMEGER